MNVTVEEGHPSENLIFVNFNQDCSSLSVGLKSGYRLFSIQVGDKIEQIYEGDVSENVCIVERLFSSSLVALVSQSSPRKLIVCHFKKGTEICNYCYSNTILNVKLNRDRLVVCLEESLYIHNIRDMKVLHTIRDTPSNPRGICALSTNSNDNCCYLAYPGSNQIGEVQIFDAINLRAVTMIPAHDNPVAALQFNSLGTKLATASEKGTVIRVFSIPDGQRLFEFRRGVKRCVQINSFSFSLDSTLLACSSNTETVHIFKLEGPKEKPLEEQSPGWMGFISDKILNPANYLPSQVSDMFNQSRDFATAKLPVSGLKTVCALATIQRLPRLIIASADGYLYMYNIDPIEGGDCSLIKQHKLDAVVASPSKDDTVGGSAAGDSSAGASGTSCIPALTTAPVPLSSSPTYATAARINADIPSTPPADQLTFMPAAETQLYREVEASIAIPSTGHLNLDDDGEFPPMTQRT